MKGIRSPEPCFAEARAPDVRAPDERAPDVLVAGAGIVGMACALELRRRGASVEVWDKGAAGGEAGTAGAGMLAPLAEVPEHRAFFDVCRESRDLWLPWADALEEDTGVDLDYDRSGALVLRRKSPAREPASGSADHLRQAAERLGEPWRELDRGEVLERLPDAGPGVVGALWLSGEHRVDNGAVCRALAKALSRLGVPVNEGRALVSVRRGPSDPGIRARFREGRRSGERPAGALLVAAGAWSGDIDGLPPLPVRPVKGQMIRYGDVHWPFEGCVRHGSFYAVRRKGGRLLVGATVEEAGWDKSLTAEGTGQLRDFVEDFFPPLSERSPDDSWAGLRPGSPDGMPLLGAVGERTWIAAGHYRNGILLAPWTAHFMADAVLGTASGASPPAAAAALLRPQRFEIGSPRPAPLGAEFAAKD